MTDKKDKIIEDLQKRLEDLEKAALIDIEVESDGKASVIHFYNKYGEKRISVRQFLKSNT